jgi:hypothetical protein
MTTKVHTADIHDMALDMFHHLKERENSPAKTQHIFRMICAVERSAAGVLDEDGEEHALKDIEAAGTFCQAS